MARPSNARRCGLSAGLAALCLGVGVLPLAAQEKPARFYAGVGVGIGDYQGAYEGIDFDDTPLGPWVYGGIRLRDRVAGEIVLARFAHVRSGDVLGSGLERLSMSADYRSVAARGVFSLELAELVPRWRNWTVFGALGAFSSEEHLRVTYLVSERAADVVREDSGVSAGGGVVYAFARTRLRMSFEVLNGRYSDLSLAETSVEFRF